MTVQASRCRPGEFCNYVSVLVNVFQVLWHLLDLFLQESGFTYPCPGMRNEENLG